MPRPAEIPRLDTNDSALARAWDVLRGTLNPWLRTLTASLGLLDQVIAGCTVSAAGVATNDRNVARIEHTAATGEYVVHLTANAASKYVPLVTIRNSPFGADLSIGVQEDSSTAWRVQIDDAGAPTDTPFSFVLLSMDS